MGLRFLFTMQDQVPPSGDQGTQATPEVIVRDEMDIALAGDFSQLHDVLDELGGAPLPPVLDELEDLEHTVACKDATIKQLQVMLESLLPLSEELEDAQRARRDAERRTAHVKGELRRLRQHLTHTSEELEATRHGNDQVLNLQRRRERSKALVKHLRLRIRRLERTQMLREGVLSRERKRHAATREKLKERRAVATERWNEIQRLRKALREANGRG